MTGIRTPDDDIDRPGYLYPPFREGRTYQGATYPGHSDFAVDWNARTPAGGWLSDAGEPVLAAADGTVSEVDKGDGLVAILHGPRWRTEYRHMAGITVKVGDKLQRGDRIGSIGDVAGSGRSVGAHLHHCHLTRETARSAWKATKMRFEGVPVRVSVEHSNSRTAGWTPPAPVMVVGPPPKATWEGAFREASKALTKALAAEAAQRAQVGLVLEERNNARRAWAASDADLTAAQAQVAALDNALTRAQVRILELEATTAPDCMTAQQRTDAAEAIFAQVRAALGLVA